MVARYADGVLTRPPRPATAIAIFGGAGLLVAGLIGFALRRARRASPAAAIAEPRLPQDERQLLEDRLTDELSAID